MHARAPEEDLPLLRVAYARSPDAATAVRDCRDRLGPAPTAPSLVMAFCGGKHDPAAMLAALHATFGPVPVVGGSAAGAIGRDGLGHGGFELGLIAFDDPAITPHLLVEPGLLAGGRVAGAALGARIRAVAAPGAVVLLLFDSVASSAPPRLHHASALVEGINAGLAGAPVTLFGGGLLTDMNLTGAWVFDGTGVTKHAAIALVFPPAIGVEIAILHGCRPVSAFMEITRIVGAEVFELDGEPALAVIERMLGLPLGGARGQELSLVATLGEKQGDPFAPYDENAYVNRLILRADPAAGSVTLFEPDFARGTRVQIMSRDNTLMLDSVRRGVAAMNAAAPAWNPLLALYVDCAGRASARSGAVIEEAALVRDGLDPTIPFLGFYSGVEVAPFANQASRPLDWTGVLALLRLLP